MLARLQQHLLFRHVIWRLAKQREPSHRQRRGTAKQLVRATLGQINLNLCVSKLVLRTCGTEHIGPLTDRLSLFSIQSGPLFSYSPTTAYFLTFSRVVILTTPQLNAIYILAVGIIIFLMPNCYILLSVQSGMFPFLNPT